MAELSEKECKMISGGTSFWFDISYIVGATVHGLMVFGTEGGRNAKLCVK